MPLPTPTLDDRRFQDLVDEAKLFIQQRCPEWSDHNLSDPGVTLIEAFAQMVDQLVYRVNRVPERNYVKFLDLIGLKRFAPAAASVPVTFWLGSIPTEPVLLPTGMVVSTRRTEVDDAIEFTTVADGTVVPVTFQSVRGAIDANDLIDPKSAKTRSFDEELAKTDGFACFASPPAPGNALYIGLSDAAPGNVVVLELGCTIEGIGVDPTFPPLVWEAWDGEGWVRADLDRDTTGGLNRNGEVVIHLPAHHEASIIAKIRAGWIRARIVEAVENQPIYSASPTIQTIRAHTIGVTVPAIHARIIDEEVLGVSDGTPGQHFALEHKPIVRFSSAIVETSSDEGWTPWTEVQHFSDSHHGIRSFVLDGVDGNVSFAPSIREYNGSLKSYGAIPPKGSSIRLRNFALGGGVSGNVNRSSIQVLVSSFPGIDRVENRHPGIGGRDAETVDEAMVRGPLLLRSRGPAVTSEDFEEIAKEAAPEAARIRCVPAGMDGPEAGAVRVLVVPNVASEAGRLPFERLLPPELMLQAVTEGLEKKRLIGTRISVEPPVYQGITVVSRVRAKQSSNPIRLQAHAVTALYEYFHPISGGPDSTGWPFGRPILLGEIYAVLQRVTGVEFVQDARLFGADPISGERGQAVDRIDVGANALVFSFDHQVMVEVG
jgi:predicted phage baseplate assembly protein